MTIDVSPEEVCASCGLAAAGRFCSACGERRLDEDDLSFRHFVQHSLHDVLHLDTKIFRSVRKLLTHPGELTEEFFSGRRVGLLTPVQLFVMVNIIFFFVAPKLGLFRFGYDYYAGNRSVLVSVATRPLLDQARGTQSIEEFRSDFDHEIDHPKRLLIFIMVFLFAFVSAMLMRRRKHYVEHVVFALHYYAFWMVLMIVLPALLIAGGRVVAGVASLSGITLQRLAVGDLLLIPTASVASIAYLWIAIRRFFGYGKIAAASHATILTFAMLTIFLVYRGLLFLLAVQLV